MGATVIGSLPVLGDAAILGRLALLWVRIFVESQALWQAIRNASLVEQLALVALRHDLFVLLQGRQRSAEALLLLLLLVLVLLLSSLLIVMPVNADVGGHSLDATHSACSA